MEYKPLSLKSGNTVTLRILPHDDSPTSSRAIHYIKEDYSHYIRGYSFDCEWVCKDKEKVVINRFTFLDLEE